MSPALARGRELVSYFGIAVCPAAIFCFEDLASLAAACPFPRHRRWHHQRQPGSIPACLLEGDGQSLLLDCGGNVARHFRASELSPDVPGAIWLSHMHSDHIGQFSMLIQSLWLRQRQAPLHVFGPAKVLQVMQEWLVRCILFPGLLRFPIEWHPRDAGRTRSATARSPSPHLPPSTSGVWPRSSRTIFRTPVMTAMASRSSSAVRRYVYSADLAHPRELVLALKQGEVTALICELAHFPERELFRELAPHDVKSLWLGSLSRYIRGRREEVAVDCARRKVHGSRPFVAGQGCRRYLIGCRLGVFNPLPPMANELSKPSLPIFSWIGHLKDDDRELLSSYGEFFPGHPDTVIIEEGDEQTEVFVVISGKLQVHAQQDDGVARLLAEVGPGETLGEISLFTPGPATATVIATEFSQLWRIKDSDLIQFMTDNPGAGNVLLRTLATILAQRLRQVDPQFYGLSAYAVVDSPGLPPAPEAAEESGDTETTSSDPEPSASAAEEEDDDAPAPGLAPTHHRVRTGTVPLPDPDELEPL